MKLSNVLIATLSTLPLMGCTNKVEKKDCCKNTASIKQKSDESNTILLKQIDNLTKGMFAYKRGEVEIGAGELAQWGFLIEALEKYTGLKETSEKMEALDTFFKAVGEDKKVDPNGDGKQNCLDVIHLWKTQK